MPEAIFSRNGESPAGGDHVRRLTFRKTAIVYEAEAPCFSLWVLSLMRNDTRQTMQKKSIEQHIKAVLERIETINNRLNPKETN